MKIVGDLLKRFNGFSGGIFIFGSILVLLGLTTGLPDYGLAVQDDCRVLCWLIGLVFCCVGVVLKLSSKDEQNKMIDTDTLSPTQRKILNVIVDEYKMHGVVSQNFIENKFKNISIEEMFYRLEYLLAGNLITKEKIGHDGQKYRFSYKLSEAYRSLHKIPLIDPDLTYEASGTRGPSPLPK